MPFEIERKFLVKDDGWKASAGPGQRLCQGYIAQDAGSSVRVRVAGDKAWLTVKGTGGGLVRPEFEYAIPAQEAREMLRLLCDASLVKTRFRVPHDGMVWEVDVFEGHAQGLVLAEVELSHLEQAITLPPWAGQEVTDDPRYRNAAIVREMP